MWVCPLAPRVWQKAATSSTMDSDFEVELTSAESVDRRYPSGSWRDDFDRGGYCTAKETEMDAVEVTKLVESALRKARNARNAGTERSGGSFSNPSGLPEAAKKRVIREALAGTLPEKDGALDVTKFRESVTAAAKEMGEFLGTVAPHGVSRHGLGRWSSRSTRSEAFERRTAEEKRTGRTCLAGRQAVRPPDRERHEALQQPFQGRQSMLNERYQDRPGDARALPVPVHWSSRETLSCWSTQALVALTRLRHGNGHPRLPVRRHLRSFGDRRDLRTSPQVAAAIAPGARLYAAGTA